jgi:hypothetical protein
MWRTSGMTVGGEPVFVDDSGRRRWVATLFGTVLGVCMLVALGLVAAGLFGVSPVSLPGLPAEDVRVAPVPVPASAPITPTYQEPSAAALRPRPTASGTVRPTPTLTPAPPAATATPNPTGRRSPGPPPGHGKPSKTR